VSVLERFLVVVKLYGPAKDADPARHCTHAPARGSCAQRVHRRSPARTDRRTPIGGSALERSLDELTAEHTGQSDGAAADIDATRTLAELARRFELDPFERDVLLFAIAPELDGRYARIYAELGDNPGARRLSVGLAVHVLGSGDISLASRFSPHGRLRRWGLCDPVGAGPLAEQALAVPVDVWTRILGEEPPARFARSPSVSIASLLLDRAVVDSIEELGDWFAASSGKPGIVVIRGPSGSGRMGVAQAIAGPLLVASSASLTDDVARQLARDARWAAATAVVTGPGVGATTLETITRTLARPVIVIVDDAPLAAVAGDTLPVRELALAPFEPGQRSQLWARALAADADQVDTTKLGATMRVGPGRIQRTVELARERMRGSPPGTDDLRRVCRALGEVELGMAARRLAADATWDDLVVSNATRKELELIATWTRLAAERSDRRRIGAGFAALFHGPSGTGKTLAAQVVAASVGLDLYRVDLSQVVDKYIGETEKNLARVFDEAERANVILFFDEADALFGKRTDVKDAHDRWANIETGFLLQRIEEHPGLSILATNLLKNLDEAHMRRLHVKAEFPRPDVAQRQAIWARHVRDLEIESVDLAFLGRQFELAGGDIRNAVTIGVLMARGEHAPLAMRHLVIAAFRELRKAGRLVNPDEFGPWRDALVRYVGSTGTSRTRSNGSSTST
jgi:hypothetical protein